jgi:hypothetical protein
VFDDATRGRALERRQRGLLEHAVDLSPALLLVRTGLAPALFSRFAHAVSVADAIKARFRKWTATDHGCPRMISSRAW